MTKFNKSYIRDKFAFKIYLNPLFKNWTDLVVNLYKVKQNN